MDEALLTLLESKDLEYVTVKEICEQAEVNRSTFYLHYETMGDLVNEALALVDARFLSYFAQDEKEIWNKLNGNELKDLVLITEDYLQPYLRFVSDNKKVYRAAFRNPDDVRANVRYGNLKRHILEPVLEKFGVPAALRKYYIVYYIKGIAAILREWLNDDCSDPVETIAAIIEDCVRPFHGTEGRTNEKWCNFTKE